MEATLVDHFPALGVGQRKHPLWTLNNGDTIFVAGGDARSLSSYGRVVGQKSKKADPNDIRKFSVRSADGGVYVKRVQ